MNYNLQHIRRWFEEHPAISTSKIEMLCEIPKDTLRHFIKDRREIPEKFISKLQKELANYGYKPLEA